MRIFQIFRGDSYSAIQGVNKLILVYVYLSSCPPKQEVVIDAITNDNVGFWFRSWVFYFLEKLTRPSVYVIIVKCMLQGT